MDSHHGCATIFHALGKVQHIDAALIPAKTAFDRDRYIHCFHNSLDDLPCQLRCTHQAAAIAGIGNLGHGTAHININKITAGDIQSKLRTFGHDLRIITKDLSAAHTGICLTKQCCAFLIFIAQGTGRNHLCDRKLGAKLRADIAERPVGHTGHRSQRDGGIHLQSTDLHTLTPFYREIIA